MRLTPAQIETIRQVNAEIVGAQSYACLFGAQMDGRPVPFEELVVEMVREDLNSGKLNERVKKHG